MRLNPAGLGCRWVSVLVRLCSIPSYPTIQPPPNGPPWRWIKQMLILIRTLFPRCQRECCFITLWRYLHGEVLCGICRCRVTNKLHSIETPIPIPIPVPLPCSTPPRPVLKSPALYLHQHSLFHPLALSRPINNNHCELIRCTYWTGSTVIQSV